ncbi:MAG TPA: CPBP family intramembrane metalloprotease, partial [Saprospiraceae bacterium]|nr:CPBP family intramembrane metalloprotease [Saprospiraceae bacterium]
MMQNNEIGSKMPLSKTLGVLIGFPIISTLISLLFINRYLITDLGLNFGITIKLIIIIWYLTQIYLIAQILRSEGWSWSDIGYSFNTKKTIYFCLSYLIFAFGLLFFIEYTLANNDIDNEKLKSIIKLSPDNTTERVIFIFMGLVAGLAEEFVYRGFAIKSLISNKINKWLAVFLAAIPFVLQHGIKAYQ